MAALGVRLRIMGTKRDPSSPNYQLLQGNILTDLGQKDLVF